MFDAQSVIVMTGVIARTAPILVAKQSSDSAVIQVLKYQSLISSRKFFSMFIGMARISARSCQVASTICFGKSDKTLRRPRKTSILDYTTPIYTRYIYLGSTGCSRAVPKLFDRNRPCTNHLEPSFSKMRFQTPSFYNPLHRMIPTSPSTGPSGENTSTSSLSVSLLLWHLLPIVLERFFGGLKKRS